jgi:hypothetical protein
MENISIERKLELSLRPAHALVVPNFLTSTTAAHWYRQTILRKDLWRFSIDHYVLGMAYYAEMESGDVARYHQLAAQADSTVDLVLPAFRQVIVQAVRFLWNPTKRHIPAKPRAIGGRSLWVHGGLTMNDTEGDVNGLKSEEIFGKGHIDSEGLAPYPHLMLSADTLMYSVCLSIAVPASGGGLHVWEGVRHAGFDREIVPPEAELTYCPYRPGTLILFDSFLWHRIERIETNADRPHRIVGVMHFLYLSHPYPHWEYWY